MTVPLRSRRDLYGGGIVLCLGLAVVREGVRLGIGSLHEMGPGYVPLLLGILLCGLGLTIGAMGVIQQAADEIILGRMEWRGWLCIIGGAVSFVILGQYAGLVPASFCTVCISAMGDRSATIKGTLVLASIVTFFGVVLFSYVLQISIPLFSGPLFSGWGG